MLDGLGLASEVGGDLLAEAAFGKGHLAGEQEVQGTAQAVEVGPDVDRVGVQRLLRRRGRAREWKCRSCGAVLRESQCDCNRL